MILTFLFYLFVAYLVYRLVFGFILPVYRTTRRMRSGFREMQERMRGGYDPSGDGSGPQFGSGQMNGQARPASGKDNSPADPGGEYIEFEEVK